MKDIQEDDGEIDLLIQAVYKRFHYDFSLYSKSSLRRRLNHACIKFNCEDVVEIKDKVLYENDFFPKLLAYLTVNTTELFRDPTYFLSLKSNVFPFLKTYPSIKLWIAGCSTGEEVYSMAIMLRESGIKKYLLYATDINPMNLEAARRGIYEVDVIQKASIHYRQAGGKESLSQYYDEAYGSVKFNPNLLENVVFSDHSLATDSVFSEMHLISCRNVLIYFERPLQNRVLALFDESLVREGFLGLGNKETIQLSTSKDRFKVIDTENRIYRKAF